MIDSFYLVLEYLQAAIHPGVPTPCTVDSIVSCTKTVQGPFAHYFGGVPNPMLGMLWYCGAFTYGATRLLGTQFSRRSRAFVGIVLILGILFSYRLYLASILQLGGVCPFCLTSTTASTLITLAFMADEAAYPDTFANKYMRQVFSGFQLVSTALFVIGLPLFFFKALRWTPEPLKVITHWSFPLMVCLVIIMAFGQLWAFSKLRSGHTGVRSR